MAEEKIVFKVVADYDKAIKEWQQLRDKVASTSKEYKECQVEINRLKVAKGELTGEVFKTKEALVVEKQALVQSNIEYKKREKELNKTFTTQAKSTQSVDKMTASNKQLGTQLKKTTNSTGAASAAAMELGRVVSDAPYGIRGMANNVSQLASQLFYMAGQQKTATTAVTTDSAAKVVNTTTTTTATVATVGFTGALRLMWTALMGPLGVLLGLQVVIASIDHFFGGMKKAEVAAKSLADQVGKDLGQFMRLNDVLQDNRNSLAQKTEALRLLNKNYPEATELSKLHTEALASGNVEVERAIELEEEYTEVIIEEAKKRAATDSISAEATVLFDLQQSRQSDIDETKKYLIEKANLLGKSVNSEGTPNKEVIKDNIKLLESNYDTAKSFKDQTKEVKKAYKAISDYGKFSSISGKDIIAFRDALQKNGKEIDKSNKKITRLSDLTKDLFKPDGKKEAVAEAAKLAKELEKLSIRQLERTIIVNNAQIASDTLTQRQKIVLLNKTELVAEAAARKRLELANLELTNSGSDDAIRKQNLIDLNNALLEIQLDFKEKEKEINESYKNDEDEEKDLKEPKDFNKDLEDFVAQQKKLDEKIALLVGESKVKKIEIRKIAHIARLEAINEENRSKSELQANADEAELKKALRQQIDLNLISEKDAVISLKKFTDNRMKEVAENDVIFAKKIKGWRTYYGDKAKIASLEQGKEKVTREDRVNIRKNAHIARLGVQNEENRVKFAIQADAHEADLKAYLEQQVRLHGMSEADAATRLSEFTTNKSTEVTANAEGFAKLIALQKAYYAEKARIAKELDQKDSEEEEEEARLAEQKKFEDKLNDLISYAEAAKEILSSITDFTDAEFERELTIEQNKTNVLNNELKTRLQNENLSKDQRQAIQDKIAQNDEKLRVKQEAIEKKRFKMQKAANMATAIINTALAATGVLKDTKGGSFARIAGMIAVIGSGLAQVATISRQKFQTSAGSSPSVAGGSNGNISNISNSGGGDRAEPAFNIVGMGANNQLLEAIQAQFDKPLRAYVVSREVTRQQNLDASIKTGAGI